MTLGGLAKDRGMADGITLAGAVAANAVAAGAGDNVQVTGAEVDRLPAGSGDAQRYDSCAVSAFLQATLAATETATLSFSVEHADISGGPYVAIDAADQPPNLVLTGAAGGSTEQGAAKHGIRLSKLKRFVRVKTTVDLSAGAADVAAYGAGFVLGGAHVLPTP